MTSLVFLVEHLGTPIFFFSYSQTNQQKLFLPPIYQPRPHQRHQCRPMKQTKSKWLKQKKPLLRRPLKRLRTMARRMIAVLARRRRRHRKGNGDDIEVVTGELDVAIDAAHHRRVHVLPTLVPRLIVLARLPVDHTEDVDDHVSDRSLVAQRCLYRFV